MPPKLGKKSVSFDSHTKELQCSKGEGLDTLGRDANGPSRTRLFCKTSVPNIKSPITAVPFHLLLVLAAMFKLGFTTDVLHALGMGLLTLIPLQAAHNVILAYNTRPPRPKKNKANDVNVPLLVSASLVVSMCMSLLVFAVVLLLGAPLASHLWLTFLMSVHLSVLIFSPLLVLYKFDINAFTEMFSASEHVYRLIFGNAVLSLSMLAIMGTWVGVVPIPLDWDRPWQQWPITLVTGGYLGSIVGSLVSQVAARGDGAAHVD